MAKLRLFGYNNFIASSISFFVLLTIGYLSTLPSFKSLNNALNNRTLTILILFLFLFILALLYRNAILRIIKKILSIIVTSNELEVLEESYSKKYHFIIMGVGNLLLLIVFLLIINIPPPPFMAGQTPSMYGLILAVLILFGVFIFIPIGIVLLIVSFSAKMYLESQVSFTLEKANKILSRAENNQLDTEDAKDVKRYIYLTYRNIKRKFRTLDSEYTFLNLLSDYLDVGRNLKLEPLKNNLEIMSKFVKEKDESGLATELLKLNNNIINYLKEIGFNLTDEKLSRQSSWMLRNKDTIINAIIMVLSVVSTIVGYFQYQKL